MNTQAHTETSVELTGGEILIRALLDQGVDTIFGYPGGVVLGVYDVLYKTPELRHILVRHEQGGTHAAEGYARATGKTGVVMATSGLLTGQVPSTMIGNDAFQEADIIGITRPITKHSYLVKNVNELGDVIKEAFHIAESGRPGPVLIDLPKDMLFSKGIYDKNRQVRRRFDKAIPACAPSDIEAAAALIRTAKKPLLYVGGGVILGKAWDELRELA
ncbi:MAG: biosynthetic-type acetolactate synthase large subunit, partial [Bacteroidota bacterium]